MPNKHYLLINLSPFGLENKNEIFVPTDEPHGQIEASVTRDGLTPFLEELLRRTARRGRHARSSPVAATKGSVPRESGSKMIGLCRWQKQRHDRRREIRVVSHDRCAWRNSRKEAAAQDLSPA